MFYKPTLICNLLRFPAASPGDFIPRQIAGPPCKCAIVSLKRSPLSTSPIPKRGANGLRGSKLLCSTTSPGTNPELKSDPKAEN